jgi:hypothetical protein
VHVNFIIDDSGTRIDEVIAASLIILIYACSLRLIMWWKEGNSFHCPDYEGA